MSDSKPAMTPTQLVGDIALLVLAHRSDDVTRLTMLYGYPFEVFVHIDAKSNISVKESWCRPNFHFVPDPIAVYWAGFSMIRATLKTISFARSVCPGVRSFCLLSGDSLPLLKPEALASAITNEQSNAIELKPVQDDPSLRGVDANVAIQKYGNRQEWRFQNFDFLDSEFTCPRWDESWANKYGVDRQGFLNMRWIARSTLCEMFRMSVRRPPLFKKLFHGSQWWIMSRALLDQIESELFSDDTTRYFEFMEVPDEQYFHCVIGNALSELDQNFVVTQQPMFVTEGDQILDFARLRSIYKQTGRLFARRFRPDLAETVQNAIYDGTYYKQIEGGDGKTC